MYKPLRILIIFLLLSGASNAAHGIRQGNYEPAGLMLTWQYDPTSTMTIDWHTEPGDEANPVVQFKKLDSDEWNTKTAKQHAFPFSDRTIHRVELTGLQANTYYRFRVGEFERLYTFRTMPASLDDRPVVFAAGGDTRHNQQFMEETNSVAMSYDPDFVAWGGDFAYADGREDRAYRWYEWFDANMNELISEDGRVVPVVASIGNHEMRQDGMGAHLWFRYQNYQSTDEWRLEYAPYFFNLFAFPGLPGYGTLDFGNYLTFFLLDSEHTNPAAGPQADWLDQELRERVRRGVTHLFPLYHIGAYPSERDFDLRENANVRNSWSPLFEKYRVQVALENHDHTYKRTRPIRNNEVHEDGVVYIGDGAWGVNTREGVNRDAWYIEKFASVRHAIIVTLDGPEQRYEVVSNKGEIIDTYTTRSPR